jgi:YhcH/YjgK/YiaL family protein
MNQLFNRREFLRGALLTAAGAALGGAGGVLVSAQRKIAPPAPRVHRLARWRSIDGLQQFKRAFEFLESGSIADLPAGRHPLDGERMYAVIAQDMTRAVETAQFEAHRKYIDLHYLIRGRELIGSADAAGLREVKPYSAEVEAALYERPRKYKRFIMDPGEFVLFFPGQAHMPGCAVEQSAEIKKAVVKILAGPA